MKEVIEQIIKFLEDRYCHPGGECGSDFDSDDCHPCKHYYRCAAAVKDSEKVKAIRKLFDNKIKDVLIVDE